MKDLKSSLDFRRAIRIVQFHHTSCDYTLEGKEMGFIADDETFAEKLKEYGYILSWSTDEGQVLIEIEYVVDSSDIQGNHVQEDGIREVPLKAYMSEWEEWEWLLFLGQFEYDKYFYGKNGVLKGAFQESFDKHSNVG